MRILAFTDPHGDLESARAIVALARSEKPDLVLCAGDFSWFGNRWRPFFEILRELGMNVYIVGGNHESDALIQSATTEFPFLKDTAYAAVNVGRVIIGGLPGYDSDFWPGSTKDEDGAVQLCRDLWADRDPSKPFILLSHFPPQGALDGLAHPTPDSGGSRVVKRVAKALSPALMVVGHYHQEFGNQERSGPTLVVNPGPNGTIIELAERARKPR